MLRLFALALAMLGMAAAPALAAVVVSEKPDKVSVTVYPPIAGLALAMVTETRTVDLPAGPVRIQFQDVAEKIVPQTVSLHGLPQAIAEQNFDYQLLSPGSLIRASEGRMLTLTRTDPATGRRREQRGRVVAGAHGAVLDVDGRIEGFQCSGLPEKLVFDDLPPDFVAKPILSVDTVLPAPMRVTLSLSYLATGVSWKASYLARLSPDGTNLDLTSWITIANRTGTHFADAPIQVMAGRLEQKPAETRAPVIPIDGFDPNCWKINSGRIVAVPTFPQLAGVYDPNIGGLIRGLSETGLNDNGDNAGQNAEGYGVRTINLRQLGTGRTLILFDGVRLADDPQTNGGRAVTFDPFVTGGGAQNINNIPMELLGSVDVLRGGGSAAYGGDASAGAVNFSPRRVAGGEGWGAQEMVTGPALAQAEIMGSRFADYTLYALPEPTTLAAYQTKQLFMFERKDVAVDRVYRHDVADFYGFSDRTLSLSPQPAQTILKLKNETSQGLGLPLPAGQVTIMAQSADQPPNIAGEPQIDNTAAGLALELPAGPETNVAFATRLIPSTLLGWRAGAEVEVTITNALDHAAWTEVRDPGGKPGEKIIQETVRHEMKDGRLVWAVEVPAHSSRILRYTAVWTE